MDPRIRLPEELLRTFTAESPPAGGSTPKPASSVIMLRDTAGGLEVLLQVRAATMAFAGGLPSFPGGRIDLADSVPLPAWTSREERAWAGMLGVDPAQARAVVSAAVRETFEESGYLLATHADGRPITDLTSDQWRTDRDALAERRTTLAELLGRRDLILRADWLKPWSVWVTPSFEPRRYHTWFLVAKAPREQRVLGVSGESTEARWVAVDRALRAADNGDWRLLPPQYCTFLELYEARDVEDVFGRHRTVPIIRPKLATDADGTYLALPDELIELGRRTESLMYGPNEGAMK